MHSHKIGNHEQSRHLSHLNFLFTGWGSRVYEHTMVHLTRPLYQRVIKDLAALQLDGGKVLDVGTGPGVLVRDIARAFPRLQVYGVDLSTDMIQLARERTTLEQLNERVQFDTGDVRQLPYPDHSFDVIVSTISLHHWQELEQPLRELYRVLKPGGRLWIYDARFIKPEMIEKAQASTPLVGTRMEHQLIRTGRWPLAIYRRFAWHLHSFP
ncbi:class I SAM-dependent methyltransferase [Dictyobacter aurantiacus]|uniref:Methyltransferase type 11 domain-containing protein n=1 Tax=Dictyobacter aurantiacus TaxID=1936993 RepID=A0A401ZAG6_9CHLR|nr:class I SAM-dependent methyltransferase [Dictyobacter aurantiacus]GCE03871.1 hypothetical protein KDAU_12000 [Dictyobacter aurantiacus]